MCSRTPRSTVTFNCYADCQPLSFNSPTRWLSNLGMPQRCEVSRPSAPRSDNTLTVLLLLKTKVKSLFSTPACSPAVRVFSCASAAIPSGTASVHLVE